MIALLAPTRRRAAALAVALVGVLLVPLAAGGTAGAAVPAPASAAATWLAGQVGADGSVQNPYAAGPSVDWTVNVALGLAATGTQPDALARAMGYVGAHVQDYVVLGGEDNAGRLGYLLILVHATGGDPHAFGSPAVDLLARLDALLGTSVPGLFGTPDPYTGVTNQSLALLGLVASGVTPPSSAVDWLVAQQCSAPAASAGAWQGYRAPSGGGYEACRTSDPTDFQSPESNSTAFAVEALVAAGSTGPVPAALGWLKGIQVATGPAAGGLGQYPGGPADPNSTALFVQALVAAGQDPAGAAWSAGGATPAASLQSWQLTSGPDAGALSSPYSGGLSDLYATYQGVWGLAGTPFPLAVSSAPSSTTTTTVGPPTTVTPPTTAAPVVAAVTVTVTPRFTG